MGYMGFGMRKEVYTRKPKEAFKKLKGIYGEKSRKISQDADPDFDAIKVAHKGRFRQFYETTLFKLIAILSSIGLIVSIIWTFYFKQIYINYKQGIFEQSGIVEYYNTNKKDIELVKNFFQTRSNKISSLNHNFLNSNQIFITSRYLDKNLTQDSLHYVSYSTDWVQKICAINNGSLTVSGTGFIPKTYEYNWILVIELAKKYSPIEPSILDYIGTTDTQFKGILSTLKKNNWTVTNSYNNFQLHFNHPIFKEYTLNFSATKPEQSIYESGNATFEIVTGVITDKQIYWIKHKMKNDP